MDQERRRTVAVAASRRSALEMQGCALKRTIREFREFRAWGLGFRT